jgi:hypothetical protein
VGDSVVRVMGLPAIWLLVLGVLGAAAVPVGAGEITLAELLDNAPAFDGRLITVQGTLGRLQENVTRRGNRYYLLQLAHEGRDVMVAAQERPACRVGTFVRVQGRFDGSVKRVDATSVTCD